MRNKRSRYLKVGALLPLPSLNEWLQCKHLIGVGAGRWVGTIFCYGRQHTSGCYGVTWHKWTIALQIEQYKSKLLSFIKYGA
jgi:hypothetical protein